MGAALNCSVFQIPARAKLEQGTLEFDLAQAQPPKSGENVGHPRAFNR